LTVTETKRTQQIVLAGRTGDNSETAVKWSLRQEGGDKT
jgi:hypothetical protein